MVQLGYTLFTEQRDPKKLVEDAINAEQAGFDFSLISDHYHPWLEAQGHASYAWSVLGAVAHATEQLELMTYVTAPIIRYHPAIVAQKAATIGVMSDGRFNLGLGAGENLNEHVVGSGFPAVDIRHEMLAESVEIIRKLFTGRYVTHRGKYYDVEGAKLFDLPESPPRIGIAVSGQESCQLAGERADIMIGTEPNPDTVQMFADAGGQGKPVYGQIPICWGNDEEACRKLALEQFAWAASGWKVRAELPNTVSFEALAQLVREDDIAQLIPCGPDTGKIVQAVKPFVDAGFTHVGLVQVGQEQKAFIDYFQSELGPELRNL